MAEAQSGRLDRPPAVEALIRFPESFGRRFALFVDTEEEFDWSDRARWREHRVETVRAIPDANRRLREGGAVPVYLADYPVVASDEAVALLGPLQEAGECEIGAQLHPWNTPPAEQDFKLYNSFAGNLEEAIEALKIAAVRDAIAARFGRAPIAYRAGRYGVGPRTGALLERLGFTLDVSVRPHFDYSAEGGPDFRGFDARPFLAGPAGGLVAVPLSVAWTGRFAGLGRTTRQDSPLTGLLARTGLAARVPLTPEGTSLAEAQEAARVLLGDGLSLLSLSFHSPSLEPGHTPYVRDAGDLAAFWRWWDGMLDFLAREGVTSVGCEEIVEAARSTRSLASGDPAPLSPPGRAGPVAQR